MRSRALLWTKLMLGFLLLLLWFFLYQSSHGHLILRDAVSGQVYGSYAVRLGEEFSIGFVHSVNQSPVIDYYEVKDDGIYAEKTVYYHFGAGVETELAAGETLTYGEDGAMIITGFDKRIPCLQYFVGTVSDHILGLDGKEISLRELCGRSSRVEVFYQPNLVV